jgi:hypothetical protein
MRPASYTMIRQRLLLLLLLPLVMAQACSGQQRVGQHQEVGHAAGLATCTLRMKGLFSNLFAAACCGAGL